MAAPTTPPPASDRDDFRSLPPHVRLDDVIATVDADPVPDPHAGRNTAQDDALRDC